MNEAAAKNETKYTNIELLVLGTEQDPSGVTREIATFSVSDLGNTTNARSVYAEMVARFPKYQGSTKQWDVRVLCYRKDGAPVDRTNNFARALEATNR